MQPAKELSILIFPKPLAWLQRTCKFASCRFARLAVSAGRFLVYFRRVLFFRELLMASVATPERLVTIDEYLELACKFDGPTELVRGRIITMTPLYPWHGYVCGKVDRIVGGFIETNDRGYPACNDS